MNKYLNLIYPTAEDIKITGRIVSVANDGVVASAYQIWDEYLHMWQGEINKRIYQYIDDIESVVEQLDKIKDGGIADIILNGTSMRNGNDTVVDLGNVIREHQSLEAYALKSDINLSDYYNKQYIDGMLGNKVDKISGKVLSSNDFTDNYKAKLDNAAEAFVAEYGVTTAQQIIAFLDSADPKSPMAVKRGNDYYTVITAAKQADNKVIIRTFATLGGAYYIFQYTITDGTWANGNYGLQQILQSGTNIKTVNGQSLLGSGNISISGGSGSIAWNDITGKPANLVQDSSYVHTDNNFTNAEKQKLAELNNYDDSTLATVAKTGSYNDLVNKPAIPEKLSELVDDIGNVTGDNLPDWMSEATYDRLFESKDFKKILKVTLDPVTNKASHSPTEIINAVNIGYLIYASDGGEFYYYTQSDSRAIFMSVSGKSTAGGTMLKTLEIADDKSFVINRENIIDTFIVEVGLTYDTSNVDPIVGISKMYEEIQEAYNSGKDIKLKVNDSYDTIGAGIVISPFEYLVPSLYGKCFYKVSIDQDNHVDCQKSMNFV